MGQVFAVEHMMLRQKYALKILSGDSPSNIGWRRFQTEARTIAKLDHPSIVKVHNLGIHDEKVPYYVMELLDGETLSAIIRREGALELDTVIDLFIPLCKGLAYAHSHGIVHRDIKPSNIILVSRNRKIVPKLVDFGLVKLVGDALSPSQQLTNTGEVFGSPLYMSPEQSVGRHINERSDIYSLGCTMFEALTGAPPFVGENVVQTILKHQNEAPQTLRQASMGLDFSPEWEALITRVLAKEASERYQTMDELAADLQAIRDGKKLSVEYSTTGDGDLFSEQEEKKKAQTKAYLLIAASALVALCLVAIAIGGYLAIKQKPAVKTAHVDGFKDGGILPEQPVSQPDVDPSLEKVTVPFVQNGGKPVNGFKIYKFPANLSLGTLFVAYDQPGKKTDEIDAKGEKSIPVATKVTFETSSFVGVHPKIFRKFLPEDLQGLRLFAEATDTDDELYYVNHLSQLSALFLDGTDVTPRGLKIVEEMPSLKVLSMVRTKHVSGADLAKLKCLNSLSTINFSRGRDVSTLLQALKGRQNIVNLTLDSVPLTEADMNLLATVPNLNVLSVNCCGLTSDAIAPLATLPNLHNLYIRGNDLSPRLIDLFKDSKTLSWIEMNNPKWSAADLARIKAALGPRVSYRDVGNLDQ